VKITRTLAHNCPTAGTCPQIRDTDGEDVIVVGTPVTDRAILDELDLPEHEAAIATPRSLLYERRMLDVDELSEWLRQHHSYDLFRLETLDSYAVDSDGDDYHRYLSGADAPNAAAKQPWLDMLAADTAAGRIWRKVHVVQGALSDYERYEFEFGFAYNAPAGEQCRILDAEGPLSPDSVAALAGLGEFFVADGEHVLRNVYDSDHRFVGSHVVYGDEAVALRAVVGMLWDCSTPFAQWWSAHPQYHRSQVA
jgi:hypothetical protein